MTKDNRTITIDTRTQTPTQIVERIAELAGIERPDDAISVCYLLDARSPIVDHDGKVFSAFQWRSAWRALLGVEERHLSSYGDAAQGLRRYATTQGYLYVDQRAAALAEELDDEALQLNVETWDAELDSSDWGDPDPDCQGSDDAWDYAEWRICCATAAAYACERAYRAIVASR